jgi:mannosyltransferase OCH1-like enzyme
MLYTPAIAVVSMLIVMLIIMCGVRSCGRRYIQNKIIYNGYKIPNIIHQTVKSKNALDYTLRENIYSWKQLNDGFEYNLYDDEECVKFLKKHFTEDHVATFNGLKAGAAKADFFRLCVLYIKGGVYVDIDMRCLVPLFSWIEQNDTFIIPKDGDTEVIDLFQAFIASTPRNPILLKGINKIMHNVKNKIHCDNILRLSGPNMIGRVLNRFLKRKEETVFHEQIFNRKKQVIKVITHNIKKPKEFITYKGKLLIKSQTWFRRKETSMPAWSKIKMYC